MPNNNPLISVITPSCRGVKELTTLIRDFKNQTFTNFEHVIVWDGKVPQDVRDFIRTHENDYNLRFCPIDKDAGNMLISPGTRPRNYGTQIARGKFVCYADDDDRYKDLYLETFLNGITEDSVSIVQMSCQESRMYLNGKPDKIVLIPEVGVPIPMICHIGTPCFMVPRKWALDDPWQHEPEHDYRFIKRIIEKRNPQIHVHYGMMVDVDGLVTRGIRDFVSIPPFYRE